MTVVADVTWLSVQDLAARWNVDEETVRLIPRERLPYLAFGTRMDGRYLRRRFHPRDVEQYEEQQKLGGPTA